MRPILDRALHFRQAKVKLARKEMSLGLGTAMLEEQQRQQSKMKGSLAGDQARGCERAVERASAA